MSASEWVIERKTFATDLKFEGIGLHSGEPVRMNVMPSDGAGIVFRYGTDLYKATVENVSDTTRCTSIGPVRTVEHFMSALAAAEVTDCVIELTAPELPSLDGSSLPYIQAFDRIGYETLSSYEIAPLFERIFVQEEGVKVAISAGEGHWAYDFVSPSRYPFCNSIETSDVIRDYRDQIAPARTWAFEEQVETLRELGLGSGLDLASALVIGQEGFVNEPRLPKEPARHKLLDLIGDLYLCGIPIRYLNVHAVASGHKVAVLAAAKLRGSLKVPEPVA
ncbi:MAG: UDP-3-O-acyl-N-acetylglucosamine deacetylase [Fimbriimonadaceae bacterium]